MASCRLLVFGQAGHFNIGKTQTHEPVVVFEGLDVEIIWASWCDLIFVSRALPKEPLHYRGNSLDSAQIAHVTSMKYDKDIRFFGQDLHHGALGYTSPREQTVTFFRTDQDLRVGHDPISTYSSDKLPWGISNVWLTGGGTVFLGVEIRFGDTADHVEGQVVDMPSLAHVESCLTSNVGLGGYSNLLSHNIPLDGPIQKCCANAVAFTALDDNGTIYTYSPDTRYPACIGRELGEGLEPSTQRHAHPIPYFSETKIKKIASGGYYSAAISENDELFLWGQACPATQANGHELRVFRAKDEDDDEFVRPVAISLEGHDVVPVDVSVGWGHVLVAGRVVEPPSKDDWFTVFGAGRNEHGQLGLHCDGDYIEDFVEIQGFRGKGIEQVICAGYTSYVVEKMAGEPVDSKAPS